MSDFFKWLAGLIMFSFLIYVAMGYGHNAGMGSIANFCKPIHWTGSFVASASEAMGFGGAGPKKWTAKTDYTCQYAVWGVFYGNKYAEEQQALTTLQAPAIVPQSAVPLTAPVVQQNTLPQPGLPTPVLGQALAPVPQPAGPPLVQAPN